MQCFDAHHSYHDYLKKLVKVVGKKILENSSDILTLEQLKGGGGISLHLSVTKSSKTHKKRDILIFCIIYSF